MTSDKRMCAAAADRLRQSMIPLIWEWFDQHGTRPHAAWIARRLGDQGACSARTIRSAFQRMWPIEQARPPQRSEMAQSAVSRRRGPRRRHDPLASSSRFTLSAAERHDEGTGAVVVRSCDAFESYTEKALHALNGKPHQRARRRLLPVMGGESFAHIQVAEMCERLPAHLLMHATDPLTEHQLLTWLRLTPFPGSVVKHVRECYEPLWRKSHRIMDVVLGEGVPGWLDRRIRGVIRVALAAELSAELWVIPPLMSFYKPVVDDLMKRCVLPNGQPDSIRMMFGHEEWCDLFLSTYRLLLYGLQPARLRLGLDRTGLTAGSIPFRREERHGSPFERSLLNTLWHQN